MIKKDKEIKELLDKEVLCRDNDCELSYDKPDPLLVASRYKDEYKILLCALFAYGKASLIVKFLDTLDFNLLDQSEETIKKVLENHYYRFQNSEDVIAIFIAFKRLRQNVSLNEIFYKGYEKDRNILEGIDALITEIKNINPRDTQGYNFLVSKPFKRDKEGNIKEIGNAPYKRWNMYLRWMVRSEQLDLGLWKNISKEDLILPLDTHTFNVSKKLGLLDRKNYDLKSAILITNKLKEFDKNDPIKYDFSLYRIGQENLI
jgi:uncharacterized protein (TIGR02757 family)